MSGSVGSSSYLVECYWPGVDEAKLSEAVQRAKAVLSMRGRAGRRVEFVGAILVPADETVFCLFDGAEEDVRSVTEQAGVPFERVLASLRIDGKPPKEEES